MSLSFRGGPRLEHIVRGQGGVAGEVGKLRSDVAAAFDALEQSGIHVMRFIGPSTALGAAAGIKAAAASVAAPVTWTGADFDGPLAPGTGDAIINSPKRVRLTVAGATPAHWLGGTVTVIGTDSSGAPLEEDVVSAAGAGTTDTVNYFATVEQIELPAASGTGATIAAGTIADAAAIATFTSKTTVQVFDGSDPSSGWNRARIGNRRLAYARRISFVFDGSADWDPTTIVVRGRDAAGNQITSNVSVATSTTAVTDKFFLEVERYTVPAQTGTGGICTVGPEETSVGLDLDPISNVEAVAVLREASRANSGAAWAVPVAGAVDDSTVTNAGPLGRYVPDAGTVPFDGIREYVLTYLPKTA